MQARHSSSYQEYDMKMNVKETNVIQSARRLLHPKFVSRDVGLWKRKCTTYIRPHLEYAIQAWNPYTKKDSKTLEKVQSRTTKVHHLLNDDERLKNLNLTTLEVRREREREDLLQPLKKESGINQVDSVNQIERDPLRRGGRGLLRKEIEVNCQQRSKFLTKRVVNSWNSLPDAVSSALSTNSFKNKLEKIQQSDYSSISTEVNSWKRASCQLIGAL